MTGGVLPIPNGSLRTTHLYSRRIFSLLFGLQENFHRPRKIGHVLQILFLSYTIYYTANMPLLFNMLK